MKHYELRDISKYLMVKNIIDNDIQYRFHKGTIKTYENSLQSPAKILEYWESDKPFTVENFEFITGIRAAGAIGYSGTAEYDWVETSTPTDYPDVGE